MGVVFLYLELILDKILVAIAAFSTDLIHTIVGITVFSSYIRHILIDWLYLLLIQETRDGPGRI